MSETRGWWKANHGIVGLGPEPWNPHDAMDWPTEGYDGTIHESDWDWDASPRDPFRESGHTPEEWIALCDEMLRRWAAFREHVITLSQRVAP